MWLEDGKCVAFSSDPLCHNRVMNLLGNYSIRELVDFQSLTNVFTWPAGFIKLNISLLKLVSLLGNMP